MVNPSLDEEEEATTTKRIKETLKSKGIKCEIWISHEMLDHAENDVVVTRCTHHHHHHFFVHFCRL